MATHYVGEIVHFHPPVTGGIVTATVKAVHSDPRWGTSLEVLITDGTRTWPTGSRECIDATQVLP
jgi:hypothetical protein